MLCIIRIAKRNSVNSAMASRNCVGFLKIQNLQMEDVMFVLSVIGAIINSLKTGVEKVK